MTTGNNDAILVCSSAWGWPMLAFGNYEQNLGRDAGKATAVKKRWKN
jgi:hypothetical protein